MMVRPFDSNVHREAMSRYTWQMPPRPQGTFRNQLLGVGVVFLLSLAHGIHDVLEGDPWLGALLPILTMTAQVVVLSWGEGILRKRGWGSWKMFMAVILVSVFFGFGFFTVRFHRWYADSHLQFWFWFPVLGLVVFGIWYMVVDFPRRLAEEQMRTLAAENERRKAEIARLRSNLHPHFLLNTLNAIAGLLVAEPRQARQLVSALGDLLRDSLEDGGMMRSLGEEVTWLRRYTEIFEIRHMGQITFEWELAAETLSMLIPCLLLQPLLENAITHGALKRPGGGKVRVHSRELNGKIEIAVSDDGPGIPTEKRSGLGLRLVRDRLELAFPEASMTIDSTGAGTTITLTIPKPEKTK
jgi:signal transduction histidine kinase